MAFRSEGDARAWEQESAGDLTARNRGLGTNPGATVPVEVLGELSRRWYGDRLEDQWRPSSSAAKQALLREAGLRGAFWELG